MTTNISRTEVWRQFHLIHITVNNLELKSFRCYLATIIRKMLCIRKSSSKIISKFSVFGLNEAELKRILSVFGLKTTTMLALYSYSQLLLMGFAHSIFIKRNYVGSTNVSQFDFAFASSFKMKSFSVCLQTACLKIFWESSRNFGKLFFFQIMFISMLSNVA